MEHRKLSHGEEKLLELLINRASKITLPSDWKTKMVVQSMKDGGMGSLRLFPKGPGEDNRIFGKRASEYQFLDKDGIPVIASLNLDSEGNLFELDIWKTDFSGLIQIPENLDP